MEYPHQQPQQLNIEPQSDEPLDLDLDVKYSTTDGITDNGNHNNNASISTRSSSSRSPRMDSTRAYQFSNKHKTDFGRVYAEKATF